MTQKSRRTNERPEKGVFISLLILNVNSGSILDTIIISVVLSYGYDS